ncbi:MAG: MFS transporter, partial [Chloroflexi bacterium]|nr:MFS transporter [Chloroflexota bacterium]
LQLGEIWHILKDVYCCIPALLRGLPRPLKALAGVIVLSFVSNAITGPFWIVYAVEHIGLATTEWGLILFIETALRNAVGIPAGMLVDHWGRTRFMVLSLALALFSVPIFILAGGFTSVLVIRMIVALSNAFFLPATAALLADTVPRDMRGRVMAALGRGTVMVGATGG